MDALYAPMQGPKNPHEKGLAVPIGAKRTQTGGFLASSEMEDYAFHEQYHTWNAYGYAVGIEGDVIGEAQGKKADDIDTVYTKSGLKRERVADLELILSSSR